MESEFRKDLAELINRHSKENGSDTPDFILARYLENVLENFDAAVKEREEWYGRVTKLSDLPDDVPFPSEMPDDYLGPMGETPPIPIDLDNENPIIDYDSTGNPPANLRNFPTTGEPPDWLLNQPTTSHKPDIHPLSKGLRDDELKE